MSILFNRSGRTDFPYPALPTYLAHRQFTGGATRHSRTPQAEALQLGIECLAFRWAEGALLTPTLQMTFQSLEDIPVQLTEQPERG